MSEFVNDQIRQSYIDALIRERDGYRASGNKADEAEVTKELQRIGAEAAPKAKKAETRPAKSPSKETR